MPWANLDDGYPDHPKVIRLSDAAFRLHTSAVCHCAKYLTDGHVAAVKVPTLVPRYRPRTLTELVDAGLWAREGDGFAVHDYLDWNRSREQVEAERSRKSAAGRRGAARRWALAGVEDQPP